MEEKENVVEQLPQQEEIKAIEVDKSAEKTEGVKENNTNKKEKGKIKKVKKPLPHIPADPVLELKFLQHLMNKDVIIDVVLVEGKQFTGKIKWYSNWMMGLELENKKTIIFPRLMMVYYSQLKEHSLEEKEVKEVPVPDDIGKVEISILQELKNNKTPLLFHLKNNIKIEGTLEWTEKLIYHLMSLDGNKDYNLHKSSIIYFEEAIK